MPSKPYALTYKHVLCHGAIVNKTPSDSMARAGRPSRNAVISRESVAHLGYSMVMIGSDIRPCGDNVVRLGFHPYIPVVHVIVNRFRNPVNKRRNRV